MDSRRRIELQIRAVVVPYRVEVRRRDERTIEEFRLKGRALLDGLEDAVAPYPDLAEQLREARREIDAALPGPEPSADDRDLPVAPEGRPRSPGG